MATAATDPRRDLPKRPAGLPSRPSGVMPAFRGSVALPARAPAPARAPVRLAPAPQSDDELWSAAMAAAKQRALVEEEERAWAAAMMRARELVADEEHEWAALRVKAQKRVAPPRMRRPAARLVSWP